MYALGSCWVLGDLGQPCTEVCGSTAPHDAVTTLSKGSSLLVVDAVSRLYGLHDYLTTSSIDQTCKHASEESSSKHLGPAAFVYFPESKAWDCLPGESAEKLAKVYRASCACGAMPPPPPAPPPAPPPFPPGAVVCVYYLGCMPLMSFLIIVGLLSLCCCGVCCFVRTIDGRAPGKGRLTPFTRTGVSSWIAPPNPYETSLLPWRSWFRACCCCCIPGCTRCMRTFREDGIQEEIIERQEAIRSNMSRDQWFAEMAARYGSGDRHAGYPPLPSLGYQAGDYSPRSSPRGYSRYLPEGGHLEYDEPLHGYPPYGQVSYSTSSPYAHSPYPPPPPAYAGMGYGVAGAPAGGYGSQGAFYSSPGVASTYTSNKPSVYDGGVDYSTGSGLRNTSLGSASYGATPYSSSTGYGNGAVSSRINTGSRGVLKIHLKKGVGLKAADLNGKSDPYVILTCGKEVKKSKIIYKTLDPVWNEMIEISTLSFDEVLRNGLHMKVMDKDTLTKDDPLGEIHVNLEPLRSVHTHEYSEPLPTRGSLTFAISWEPVAAEQVGSGTLHVTLHRAQGLKAMDRNGKSDPYVKLTLAGKTHKSKIIKKTLDPVWEESFKWSGVLRELSADPLQLHAFDYDFGSRDDKLGHASVDLRGLEGGEVREYAVQLSEQGHRAPLDTVRERRSEAGDARKQPEDGGTLPGRPARNVMFSSPPSAPTRERWPPPDYSGSGTPML